MDSRRVLLFTLGGTIGMSGSGGGVVPRLTGADLVDSLGTSVGLDDLELVVRDLAAVPSADLSFADILGLVRVAESEEGDPSTGPATGIVVAQGTDTLEETAFLADLVWRSEVPLVFTGAMRNPTLPGADGPANLVASIQVAGSVVARGRGVLVVFDDEIHAARHVRKTHSMSTATFASPDLGPVGHVVEGSAHFLANADREPGVRGVEVDRLARTRIGLYTALLDDDDSALDGAADRYHGLVVAGFGVGHVPSALAPVLGDLATRMPVVLTSRTGGGPVLTDTYGAVGSERDLRERGLVNGGFLHPFKARVLLRLLVAGGVARGEIVDAFARYA